MDRISPPKEQGCFREHKVQVYPQTPAGDIVFGAVASNRLKMPPDFINGGVKDNTEVYIHVLKNQVLPLIKTNFDKDQDAIFQHDEAYVIHLIGPKRG